MNAKQQAHRKSLREALVSVVLPVFNEAGVLIPLLRNIDQALAGCGARFEVIFVNDGSSDDTARILDGMAAAYSHVRVLHLARNFGHQAAVQAGLEHARGAAVIVMDADLQDNPDSLPAFLAKWQEGYDVVYAVRFGRKESWLKKILFYSFYRLLNSVVANPMPKDAGNFCLLDRQVVDEIIRLADRDRYFPGLRHWVGFKQTGLQVERGARYDEHPRVSLRGLFRLAKTALFSFSTFPLALFYGVAGLSFLAGMGIAAFVLYHKFFTGLAVAGWTSLIMAVCFFGALNALGIAILGEYVARIYDQVRKRPLFIVKEKMNFSDSGELTPERQHWKQSG
jgi:dolichol-phosphate mannosyltransferase